MSTSLLLSVTAALTLTGSDAPAAEPQVKARAQTPIALALTLDGADLLVANRSGSICVFPLEEPSDGPIATWSTQGQPCELAPIEEHAWALLTDSPAQLQLAVQNEAGWTVVDALDVGAGPHSLARVGRHWVASSRWSQTLSVARAAQLISSRGDRTADLRWMDPARIELPFAPGELLALDSERVLVAAATTGEFALVDVAAGEVLREFAIEGHNVRSLTLVPSAGTVLITHQVLRPLARTSYDDVHWGHLMSNVVRRLEVDELIDGDDPQRGARVTFLGGAGAGAADPGSLSADEDGRWWVALEGTDQIVVVDPATLIDERIEVGRRPIALATDSARDRLYCADAYSNQISVIDRETRSRVATWPLSPVSESESSVQRGESLFFDARLSHDRWMSCHSCHSEGDTAGGFADTLGDGHHGSPKRVPSLLAIHDTEPFGWTGSMATLEDQLEKTLQSTMIGGPAKQKVVADLVAYLRSLPSPPLPPGDDGAVQRGRVVFDQADCGRCHPAPLYTCDGVFDVGLDDEAGDRRFNPPSLRGIARRPALFHDGRAESLEAAISRFDHPGTTALSAAERHDLIAFLRSL